MAKNQCSPAFQRNANFRAGAAACVRALAELPELVRDSGPDQSTAEYFAKKDAGIALILSVAGEMPDRAAGVVAALADVLVSQLTDFCTQSFEDIEVEATLSDEELSAYRQQFANEVGDGEEFAIATSKSRVPAEFAPA